MGWFWERERCPPTRGVQAHSQCGHGQSRRVLRFIGVASCESLTSIGPSPLPVGDDDEEGIVTNEMQGAVVRAVAKLARNKATFAKAAKAGTKINPRRVAKVADFGDNALTLLNTVTESGRVKPDGAAAERIVEAAKMFARTLVFGAGLFTAYDHLKERLARETPLSEGGVGFFAGAGAGLLHGTATITWDVMFNKALQAETKTSLIRKTIAADGITYGLMFGAYHTTKDVLNSVYGRHDIDSVISLAMISTAAALSAVVTTVVEPRSNGSVKWMSPVSITNVIKGSPGTFLALIALDVGEAFGADDDNGANEDLF
eukprot:m.43459 g.43459  ORF g.43459 m.43459 type:complete len:316 (+) comp19379_c0_seq2:262-1209(+)